MEDRQPVTVRTRAAEQGGSSAAGLPALTAGAVLLLAGLAAFLLSPGSSDLPVTGGDRPVAIGAPAEPSAERSRALARARGLDPLGPRLLQSMTLRPAPSGPGLVIAGSSDEQLLTTAGLQVGDRLLESDQVPIGSADAALVSEHFNSLDAVELTLQRHNRLRLITVDLTR
jgi:hypothetical protein